jgi:hypothetical protein
MSYFMVLRENGIVLRGSESKKVGLLIRSLGKWVLAASLALFLVLGANQNSEAEGPAVSAINAKAQGLFGSFDHWPRQSLLTVSETVWPSDRCGYG